MRGWRQGWRGWNREVGEGEGGRRRGKEFLDWLGRGGIGREKGKWEREGEREDGSCQGFGKLGFREGVLGGYGVFWGGFWTINTHAFHFSVHSSFQEVKLK